MLCFAKQRMNKQRRVTVNQRILVPLFETVLDAKE